MLSFGWFSGRKGWILAGENGRNTVETKLVEDRGPMSSQLLDFVEYFNLWFFLFAGRPRRCPPPPRIKNGQLKMSHRGMRIQYSCNPGFELAGNEFISCNMWGRWNRFSPACVGRGPFLMCFYFSFNFSVHYFQHYFLSSSRLQRIEIFFTK